MSRTLRIGDRVMWRGGFGGDSPAPAVVTNIEDVGPRTAARGKYGTPVTAIDLDSRRAVVDLDTGSWAYDEQLDVRADSIDDGDGRR